MFSNKSGNYNTAVGVTALSGNREGNNNVAYGFGAGCQLTKDNNIAIGNVGTDADLNVIRIGTVTRGSACGYDSLPAHTSTYIAGIANSTLAATATDSPKAVYINTTTGQLGLYTPSTPTPAPTPSSERLKKDINALGFTRHEVLRLRPVSFRYKQADEKGDYPLQYGLIAEEVAKVLPALVAYDKDGTPLGVHYNLLTPLLLEELQQQHDENQRSAQEVVALRAQTADQAARMESLERKFMGLQIRADAR